MTHPWLQLASGLKCWALWGVHFGRYPLAVVGPDYTCHVVGGVYCAHVAVHRDTVSVWLDFLLLREAGNLDFSVYSAILKHQ